MTALQKDLIYKIIIHLNDSNIDHDFYHFNIADIMKETHSSYVSVRDAFYNLRQKHFYMANTNTRADGKWKDVGFIASSEMENGVIEVELSKKVKPYFVELQNRFTMFSLKTLLGLKSVYSKRLYEILVEYRSAKNYHADLFELKERLFVVDEKGTDKYSGFGIFRLKVLDVAKKEINEKTDIQFSYTEKKQGRKVIGLVFHIASIKNEHETKKSPIEISYDEKEQTLMERLYELGLVEWQVTKIIKKVGTGGKTGIWKLINDIKMKNRDGRINEDVGGYAAKIFDRKYKLGFFNNSQV